MKRSQFVYVTYIKTTPEKLWSALTGAEFIQQLAAARIGQRFEHGIHRRANMQPKGCLSSGNAGG